MTIERLTVGHYYRWTGKKNCYEESYAKDHPMHKFCDGKWHKCLRLGHEPDMQQFEAAFEGVTHDGSDHNDLWYWDMPHNNIVHNCVEMNPIEYFLKKRKGLI